jgi:EAL domain-containing protein (putative c-di-GMP-specific phosphodiesterase class I)
MGAVAEGVEDRNDWDFVRSTECETAQGYFVGRAMPAETILSWSAKWRERVKQDFAGEK